MLWLTPTIALRLPANHAVSPRTLVYAIVVAVVFAIAQLLASVVSFSAYAADLQIKDLNDLDFGEVPATIGTLQSSSDFCVAMQPRGRYSLVGFGNGSGGAFSLIDTGNGVRTLDYSVRISDRGRRRGQELVAGVPLPGLRASRFRNNGRCNPLGRIEVTVDGNDIQGARPGRYSGTLMLTVVPE